VSSDTRQEILVLLCSAIQEATDIVLTKDRDAPMPNSAISILAEAASHNLNELVASDFFLDALVAVQHITAVFSRTGKEVTEAMRSLSSHCEKSSEASEAIFDSLARMLDSPFVLVE
jgi:hypothetical protein